MKVHLDKHADEVLRGYSAKTDAEVRGAWLALTAEYQRGQTVRSLARDMVRGGQKAWLYYFSYPSKGEYAREGLGAFHGLELAFVGGGFFRKSQWGDPDAEDRRLAGQKTGNVAQVPAAAD